MGILSVVLISGKSSFVNVPFAAKNNERFSVIKAIDEDRIFYLSYCGGKSSRSDTIEIPELFATLNGVKEGDFMKVSFDNIKSSSSKFRMITTANDYEV